MTALECVALSVATLIVAMALSGTVAASTSSSQTVTGANSVKYQFHVNLFSRSETQQKTIK